MAAILGYPDLYPVSENCDIDCMSMKGLCSLKEVQAVQHNLKDGLGFKRI